MKPINIMGYDESAFIESPKETKLFEKLNECIGTEYTHDNHVQWSDFDTEEKLQKVIDILEENVEWKKFLYGEQSITDHTIDIKKNFGDNDSTYTERKTYLVDPYTFSNDERCKVIPDYMLEKYADKFDWVFICLYQPMDDEKIRRYDKYVNWTVLSMYRIMSEKLISDYSENVVWKYIPNVVTCQKLSNEFVDMYHDKVNWTCVCTYSELTLQTMQRYINKLDWKNVCAYQINANEAFLEEYENNIDWKILCQNRHLSDGFIERHKDKISWSDLMRYQSDGYDDDFVIKYQDYIKISDLHWYNSTIKRQVKELNWEGLLAPKYKYNPRIDCETSIIEWMDEDDVDWHNIKNGLPVQFINNHPDMIDWQYLSMMFSPDDEFLEKYKQMVDWNMLVIYNRLSVSQLRRFRNCVSWKLVSIFYKMNEYFIAENAERVDWTYISMYQTLSEDFIREYKDFVDWKLIFQNQKISLYAKDEFEQYALGKSNDEKKNNDKPEKDLRPLFDFDYIPKDKPFTLKSLEENKEIKEQFAKHMQKIAKSITEIFGQ